MEAPVVTRRPATAQRLGKTVARYCLLGHSPPSSLTSQWALGRRTSLALSFSIALASACAPRGTEPTSPRATSQAPLDVLTEPRLVGPDFVWRQKLSASYGDDSFDFEAVLEKSDNALRVLFLTPYGSRALLLEQLGQQVRTEYFVSQRLPFPAHFILGDIHRVFFRGFEGQLPPDGSHTQRLQGEVFHDTWQHGSLVSRTVEFENAEPEKLDQQAGAIAIRYAPGYRPGAVPGQVFLENHRHGYEISIDTLPD